MNEEKKTEKTMLEKRVTVLLPNPSTEQKVRGLKLPNINPVTSELEFSEGTSIGFTYYLYSLYPATLRVSTSRAAKESAHRIAVELFRKFPKVENGNLLAKSSNSSGRIDTLFGYARKNERAGVKIPSPEAIAARVRISDTVAAFLKAEVKKELSSVKS